MDFPHRIAETFLELRRAATIRGALERLTSRALSDLGITREDMPHIARVGARMAPRGASYVEIVAEARDRPRPLAGAGARLVAGLSAHSRRTRHILRSRTDGRPAPEPIGH